MATHAHCKQRIRSLVEGLWCECGVQFETKRKTITALSVSC